MNSRIKFFLYLFIAIGVLITFYFRINFWELYTKIGFYQGDIWYFYTYYGEQIRNQFFYPIEYPLGYIFIQKLGMFLSENILRMQDYGGFMTAHIFLILPTVLGLIWAIFKILSILEIKAFPRILILTLSPSLIIYSAINYDIFPVTLTVLSVLLLFTKKYSLSFFLLSLGTLIKVFPVFLLPLFILYLLQNKFKPSQIIKNASVFVLTYLTISFPFIKYNFEFWKYPYLYQAQNPERNDPTTISYYLLNATGLNNFQLMPLIGLLISAIFISFLFYKKNLLDKKNFLLLCFLTLFSGVFGSQVYVPQYMLWFLPFLSLSGIVSFFSWFPIDLLNASTRVFYFMLKNHFQDLFFTLWTITVFYYTFIYIKLLINVRKILTGSKK